MKVMKVHNKLWVFKGNRFAKITFKLLFPDSLLMDQY